MLNQNTLLNRCFKIYTNIYQNKKQIKIKQKNYIKLPWYDHKKIPKR